MEICCGLNRIGPGPISEVRGTPPEQAYESLNLFFDHTKDFVSTHSAHPEEFLLKFEIHNFEGLPRCTGNFCGEILVGGSQGGAWTAEILVGPPRLYFACRPPLPTVSQKLLILTASLLAEKRPERSLDCGVEGCSPVEGRYVCPPRTGARYFQDPSCPSCCAPLDFKHLLTGFLNFEQSKRPFRQPGGLPKK